MNVNKYLVPITKDEANKLVLFANVVSGTNGMIDYALQHGYSNKAIVDQTKQFKKFASDAVASTNSKQLTTKAVLNSLNIARETLQQNVNDGEVDSYQALEEIKRLIGFFKSF